MYLFWFFRTICCMLIAAGGSLLIEDHAGLSPRQLAIMAEDHELSEYLESQEEFQAERLMAGGTKIQDYETPVWREVKERVAFNTFNFFAKSVDEERVLYKHIRRSSLTSSWVW